MCRSASATTTPPSSPGLDEATSSEWSRVTESQAVSNARTCEVCPRLPEGHSLVGETRQGEVVPGQYVLIKAASVYIVRAAYQACII